MRQRHKRQHVPAHLWAEVPGTDFWLQPGGSYFAASGVGNSLADFGWTTTALALVAAATAGADFISSADVGVPPHIVTDATGDLLQSPAVFGDYYHAYGASAFLGFVPTSLNVEVVAAFSVNSANETTSGFGLVEAGGTPATANDHMAYIFTDASNFTLRSGAASDAGATDDAAWHLWKIVVTSSNVEWFIDGTSQGTIALQADLWPVSFAAHSLTTNRLLLGQVHIWYG